MNILEEDTSGETLATDVHVILQVLRSKALLIAICTGGGLLLAFLYVCFTSKVYSAQTVIQIEQEEQKVVKIEGIISEDLKSLDALKTFEQNVRSPEVLLRVVHRPELRDDPTFLPEIESKSDSAVQSALAKHIDAKLRRGTRLIDITVSHRNPVMAQKIAELLVQEFVGWNFEAKREAAERARHFLLDEATRLRAKLEQSEQAMQNYKERKEAVSLEDKQNITVEKLKELNLRVTTAKAERLKLEADEAEARKFSSSDPEELLKLKSVAESKMVIDQKRIVAEQEGLVANLSKSGYGPMHPKFEQATSQLQTEKADLDKLLKSTAASITSAYNAARETETKFEHALQEQEQKALELNKISIPYAVLARDAEADRALYNSVFTRLKETDITAELAQNPVRIVARPLLPDRPMTSKRNKALALGLLLGLACGGGIALVSSRSLNTLHEAEVLLGVRSLSEIPKLRGARQEAKPALLDHDPEAEGSFRNLRSSLLLIKHANSRRTFLFTSAHPGEGKTFCAVNCAISFAQLGLKTLIIDADLRQPNVARWLFPEAPPTGFILSTNVPNLSAIFADETHANGGHLLPTPGFEQLIRKAAAKFDRVVVDSAPVNVVNDTLLFARHVESVCLVIHAGKTPAEDVIRAAQRLAEAGAAPIGFVWNQARNARRYYDYYYKQARSALPRPVKGWSFNCSPISQYASTFVKDNFQAAAKTRSSSPD